MENENRIISQQIKLLNQLINQSENIVFFGGAGVSTESGIPDYRSKSGLYNKYDANISENLEKVLSKSFFNEHTREFYKLYKENFNVLDCKPNITHYKLAELEKEGKLSAIITQNIDRLHQKAGSKNVIELHGNIEENYCCDCNKKISANYIFKNNDEMPVCNECGGMIHPGAVLYGEETKHLEEAKEKIKSADLLIVAGTSLNVKPASTLLNFYNGEELIYINKEKNMFFSTLCINESIGKVFNNIILKDIDDLDR